MTTFLAIDWSGRSTPSPRKPTKDAIWVAVGEMEGGEATYYFRTRRACVEWLVGELVGRLNKFPAHRQIIGWDFCFGYPKGFARALRLKQKPPWRALWDFVADRIEDGHDNANNRFEVAAMLNERSGAPGGPFWGTPRQGSGIYLGRKKDFDYPVPTRAGLLEEFRLTEQHGPRMQPAWKLYGPGSVGGQVLVGIPWLKYLRDHPKLKDVSAVWPFEDWRQARVVHAEIYPSLIERPYQDDIPDREQVRVFVEWMREQQAAGKLTPLLDGSWPAEEDKRVRRHEGWVLGM